MKKIALLSILILTLIFVSQANAQSVEGSLDKKTVTRGTTIKGKIILNIPEGVHVNSSLPETEFAIPTSLKISGKGLKITKVTYPKGTDRKFEFSETPINVYENKAVVNFTFLVPRNYRGKTVNLLARLTYQACTTEVCYPPKRETVNLTATVR